MSHVWWEDGESEGDETEGEEARFLTVDANLGHTLARPSTSKAVHGLST